jgi:predicted CopG family antitoxin
MTTTIQISDENWKKMNARKQRGQTYDDVLTKALNEIPETINPLPQTPDKDMIKTIKEEVSK